MDRRKIKPLSELNLVDRFLFDETMEDRRCYQNMVSILLEREIELLDRNQTEKELRLSETLRSVRLDVIDADAMGNIYYTEMQKTDTHNLPKRSRYYQAQLDVSLLEPGTINFNMLNDSVFIMVAPFDIFGRGLYRYTFEGVCRECPELSIRDGAVRVFINTNGTNREDFSQEFIDLMKYINCTTPAVAERSNSEKIAEIHRRVEMIRLRERTGVRYMQKWEEIEYARLEGKEEGCRETSLNVIRNLLNKGFDAENICAIVQCAPDMVEMVHNEMT